MPRWRPVGITLAVGAAAALIVAALAPFLAPNLTYETRDRIAELLSGNRGRTYKIALGARAGSFYQLGETLDEHLLAKAGYRLDLIATTGVPRNVALILDPAEDVHLATVDSASDEAANATGLVALAAIERPYFLVVVPDKSPVREVRDLSGRVDTAARAAGEGPTIGDKVIEYYRLLEPSGPVSVVRPSGTSLLERLDAGDVTALTRTQVLSRGLLDTILDTGRYRLVPLPDHEALARAIPGTEAGFIPAGAYGPDRRIPSAPLPTLVSTTLLVARSDLPGRVVRDILDTIYDPKFAREIRYDLTEESGRKVAPFRLHPAAEIYYHRNDLLTSDRMGRLSFIASIVAGAFATVQFVLLLRRHDRTKARRRLLLSDLEKLRVLRLAVDDAPTDAEARALIAQADDLLWRAEQDAAADRIDRDGIETLRSVHAICWRALQNRARTGVPQKDLRVSSTS